MEKGIEMDGVNAMQWAREISRMPRGILHCAFSLIQDRKGRLGIVLLVKEHCKHRTQLPQDKFAVDSENYFLFEDENGEPRMCYRILIRYMGFPQDGYKLHKINWL